MEKTKKSSLRSALMMTDTDKRKLIQLQKKAKFNTIEEWREIEDKFYADHGYRRATIEDRWQSDADGYARLAERGG